MQSKTEGIVIQAHKYGDTSIVTHIVTRDYGMQGFLVKGVYRKKSAFPPSYFQPLNRVKLVMYYKPNRQLQNLREIQVSPIFQNIPYEIAKTSVAMFLAEVLGKILKAEAPDDDLFSYLQDAIQLLDSWQQGLNLFPLFFLLDLSHYMGFYPYNNFNEAYPYFNLEEGLFQSTPAQHSPTMNANESQHLAALLGSSLATHSTHLKIPSKERIALLNQLVDYFRLHTQNFPRLKSAQILRDVLQG